MLLTAKVGLPDPSAISRPFIRSRRKVTKQEDGKSRQISSKRLYRLIRSDINLLPKRIPWHSGRITIATALNATGRHAPGALKSSKRRKRKPLNVKPNAPQPKLRRMTTVLTGRIKPEHPEQVKQARNIVARK
jgi:hypothetical protein